MQCYENSIISVTGSGIIFIFFFSSRRRHTRYISVTGVQTCALPISPGNITKEMERDENFTKTNDGVYYKEIKVENGRRYILCFNPQLFIDQRNARERAIESFKNNIVPELNEELALAKKSRSYEGTMNKFKKALSICKIGSLCGIKLNSLVIDGEGRNVNSFQAKAYVDEKKKKNAMKLDGFWMLVTNLSDKDAEDEFLVSSEDALRPYREKVIIEDAFRDIKSFVEIAPVYVWLEKHIKAHYTICVLAYLINRSISNQLKKNCGKSSEDVKTHTGVYRELGDCSIDEIYIENLKQSNYCVTKLSEKQKDLLRRLGAGEVAKVDPLLKKFREKPEDNGS